MDVALFISQKRLFHEKSMADYIDYLNKEEIKRSHQFLRDTDKQGYVLSRVVLKTALKHYAPTIPLHTWQFGANRYGKPFIIHPALPQPLFFNLSHTTDSVVVAISPHSNVGVDIEKMRDIDRSQPASYLTLSQRFFTQSEAARIAIQPTREGQLLFWKMWTLKEAYIKYCGQGLSLGLDCIEFDMTTNPIIARHKGADISFCQWRKGDTLLALASSLNWDNITLRPVPAHTAEYCTDFQLIHYSTRAPKRSY